MFPQPSLLPALDLVRRTIAAETAYVVSRLRVVERNPGNPFGVAFRPFGDGGMALMARRIPLPLFNSVKGMGPGDETQIAAIATWYRENGVNGQFELIPGLFDEALARGLHKAGYFHSGFHVALVAEFDAAAPVLPPGVEIEPVDNPALLDNFFDAYVAGWRFERGDRGAFKVNVREWVGRPGWSLYLARVDGRPAAAATLFMHEKTGYCADAATDPGFRGRGLHRALMAQRIADAAAAGADFVCSGATFLSASHRNMERAGMRVQFVRALWTKAS